MTDLAPPDADLWNYDLARDDWGYGPYLLDPDYERPPRPRVFRAPHVASSPATVHEQGEGVPSAPSPARGNSGERHE